LAIRETVAKQLARSIASFFNICLKKVLKIFWKNVSVRTSVFIISKRQFSISNKLYETLQAEAISDVVRID